MRTKFYEEYKDNLRKAFQSLVQCKGYISREYSGEDFYKKMDAFLDAWSTLLYKGINYEKVYSPDSDESVKYSYEYKLKFWREWVHNAIHEELVSTYYKRPWRYTDFLEELIRITHGFLNAITKEREMRALEIRPRLEKKTPTDYIEVFDKWLDEKDLGIKNQFVPGYFAADISHYIRGRRLYSQYRKRENGKLDIAWHKEYWKVLRLAVKKGLIIDNYRPIKEIDFSSINKAIYE